MLQLTFALSETTTNASSTTTTTASSDTKNKRQIHHRVITIAGQNEQSESETADEQPHTVYGQQTAGQRISRPGQASRSKARENDDQTEYQQEQQQPEVRYIQA